MNDVFNCFKTTNLIEVVLSNESPLAISYDQQMLFSLLSQGIRDALSQLTPHLKYVNSNNISTVSGLAGLYKPYP